MICNSKTLRCFFIIGILAFLHSSLYAQTDTTSLKVKQDSLTNETDTVPKKTFDQFLNSRKGFLGKVMKSIRRDTTEVERANDLKRNDVPYKQFDGAIIRHINIRDLPFGVPLMDTGRKVSNFLTQLANKVHHITRSSVIRKNLFFRENEPLVPYLMADNETFLRQLPYIQDATIEVVPAGGLSLDSVDINITVKDLFSLGISISSLGLKNTDITLREDNVYGSGNAIAIHGLYDISRRKNFGVGAEYLQRNIGGSFINMDVGYQSYYPIIVGLKEENIYFFRFTRPLVNRYMHWTYEFDANYHSTRNMYSSDSVYYSDLRYRFYNIDAWAGYNINSTGFTTASEDKKLRKLVAMRFIDQQFQDLPGKYIHDYSWRYANITGFLTSLSFYRQNFYKSQYIYAFGVNEDVPEGLNLTLTTGYIKKQNLSRPYVGINYGRSAFNSKNNYFSYAIRTEGYLNHKKLEDINLFTSVDYFDHLKAMGPRWKQRIFLDFSVSKQINTILNEPLYIDSKFALPEFKNGDVGGSLRVTAKAESVFYSPWYIAAFRFAPFVFSNAGLFTPYNTPVNTSNIYTIVGAGLRTRNESLVFGTLELRGYYFLKENYRNENWRIDISTNITFKYNSQLIKRPDFIEVN